MEYIPPQLIRMCVENCAIHFDGQFIQDGVDHTLRRMITIPFSNTENGIVSIKMTQEALEDLCKLVTNSFN